MTGDLTTLLRDRLSMPLPGRHSQRPFGHQLSYGRHMGPAPAFARRAAVLVLICRRHDRSSGEASWWIPFTERQQGLGIHSGQICFAGGGIEPGETAEVAALRECEEELGWCPGPEALLGRLSPIYVYASNNLVTPIVSVVDESPQWTPDRREVASVLEVPVEHLCSSDCYRDHRCTAEQLRISDACEMFLLAIVCNLGSNCHDTRRADHHPDEPATMKGETR